MTTAQTTNEAVIKTTMDVKIKLSMLWLIVMFNMIYADILGFITPGAIEGLMTGYSGTVILTQELLFVSAILLEIPIMMILLSRVLKGKTNRWANIIAGILTILFVVGGIETEPFFLFFVVVEVTLLLAIIRIAWTLPKLEA